MGVSSGIETATGIFRYLAEYTQLRMRQQRTLDAWDATWASDWPDELEVGSAFRLGESELGSGVLVNVKKPRRTPPPTPHATLLPWFDRPTLTDSSADEPRVRAQIVVESDEPLVVEDGLPRAEPQIRRLADDPETLEQIRHYVSQVWVPWAEADRRRAAVQSLYGTLFSWLQRQTQLGEQWELILGLGLLTWRDRDSDDIIKRPLIVVPAIAEMDSVSGSISVSVQADGGGPGLELDMLPPGQRPPADVLRSMREVVAEAGDVWDRSVGNGVLRTIANRLAADAEYDETDDHAAPFESHPRVSFAPGLFLRKRTEKSIYSLLSAIERQLAETGYLPPGIAAVLGLEATVVEQDDSLDDGQPSPPAISPELVDEMVFFPKKSNDEQKMIVRKLATSRGGLIVQGPPGTGKSHTIANLICDLLARGNRVLVTSKGPRALRVLRDMLPTEVQDLCVMMLGADLESNQSLEKSIRAISEKHESWQPARANARRAQLRQQYESARSTEQRVLGEMLELREAETEQVVAVANAYSGTRAHIAQQVRTDANVHGWIAQHVDGTSDPGELPFSALECQSLAEDLAALSSDLLEGLRQCRPDLGDLPKPAEMRALFDEQLEAWEALEADTTSANEIAWTEDLSAMREGVLALRNALARVVDSGGGSLSVLEMAKACIAGDSELLLEEMCHLDAVLGQLGNDGLLDAELTFPTGVTMSQARVDAMRLSAHLKEGKGLGFGPFRPKVVKDCGYLIDGTRVDGASCSDIVALDRLIAAITEKQTLAATRERLSRHGLSAHGSAQAQLAELRSLRRRGEIAIDIAGQVPALRLACEGIPLGFTPEWSTVEGLQRVAGALDFASRRARLDSVAAQIDAIAASVMSCGRPLHPLSEELARAIASRDASRVEEAYEGLAKVAMLEAPRDRVESARRRMAERAPRLSDAVFRCGDAGCADRLKQLPTAWSWMRAELWLRRVCDPHRHEDLSGELERTQERMASAISALAAELAWDHCLSSMTEEHRRHLVAWSLAMRKLGKGTGKHAPVHRREAREHMQYCKDVIPAWIMPLYKVAETLDPQPNTFDVAIVDEASQSGPEALFVAYIAKKVIIVGDDQQISPDDVGLNVQAVQDLIDLHLSDMPYRGAFGARSSLFDQGKQFFGHPLRLREHFRCMPEIIQFSNNLCYSDQPLEPLRQFGPDRLEPIVVRKVLDGYQEDGRGTVNTPEAKAIVSQISELCLDPRYDGMTFGVISLLSSSKQAQLIERLLLETIDSDEMVGRRLVCGDAYDFQGDERDVVFLSMVNARNRRIGSLTSEGDRRRFNVAASRAKDQLWLFHSVDLEDLGASCYRRQLLEYCRNPRLSGIAGVDSLDLLALRRAAGGRRELGNQPAPFDSWFEVDVFLRIVERGFRVVPQYESGGYFIDLMVQGMNGSLAVECDGEKWHGAEQYEADVARQRKLERCGLRFWRLTESAFRRDPAAALEGLWNKLDDLRIYSEAEDERRREAREDHVASLAEDGPPEPESQVQAGDTSQNTEGPVAYVDLGLDRVQLPTATVSDQPEQVVVSPDATPPQRQLTIGFASHVKPYAEWVSRRLPDPRTASETMVRAALLEILQAEGPMCVDRLYRQYAHGAGILRVKNQVRAGLDAAMSALARSGDISRRTESLPGYDDSLNVAWVAGRPDVLVRRRGPRDLEEVPLTEMVEMLATLKRSDPAVIRSNEGVVRALQQAYELGRVSAQARERFEAVARKLSMSDASPRR